MLQGSIDLPCSMYGLASPLPMSQHCSAAAGLPVRSHIKYPVIYVYSKYFILPVFILSPSNHCHVSSLSSELATNYRFFQSCYDQASPLLHLSKLPWMHPKMHYWT